MVARLTIICFFLATFFATWGQADTLRMRDGSSVNGSYLGGSSYDIRFLVNDEVQHFARANVVSIIFGSNDTSSAARSGNPPPRSEAPPIELGPDIAGAPYLRGANGYIPLEREIGAMARGGGMYGMGGNVYRIQGSRSPVRVRQGDRIVFVVRLPSGGDARQFQLYRLESRMGYRQTQPTMGGNPAALAVTINQVSNSVYEIVPARPLRPGEYAVSPMNSNESYCFGMDY